MDTFPQLPLHWKTEVLCRSNLASPLILFTHKSRPKGLILECVVTLENHITINLDMEVAQDEDLLYGTVYQESQGMRSSRRRPDRPMHLAMNLATFCF